MNNSAHAVFCAVDTAPREQHVAGQFTILIWLLTDSSAVPVKSHRKSAISYCLTRRPLRWS